MIGTFVQKIETALPIPAARWTYLLIFLGCTFLMGVALYMEHQMHLEPCPLCVFQRVGVVAVAGIALLAALHNPGKTGVNVYGYLVIGAAAAGGSVSMRQLWLQSLPADEVPACGASLDYMMDTLPFLDVVSTVLSGDGSCAEVAWSFLGLSIPGWTLVGFVLLALAGLFQILRQN